MGSHSAAVWASAHEHPLRRSSSVGIPFAPTTRSMEVWMAPSRSWSFMPEAASGGRPSSVMALLTARQYPRRACASGSSGLLVLALWASPTHPLLQLLLGVAVGFIDFLGRLTQIVELAQLVRHPTSTRATARRMGCWPSEITPITGTSSSPMASSSRPTRDSSVALRRLLAKSTSPERQSLRTHKTSWPTSGCRPSKARTTRPWRASATRRWARSESLKPPIPRSDRQVGHAALGDCHAPARDHDGSQGRCGARRDAKRPPRL